MKKKITRRLFVKHTGFAGAGAFLVSQFNPGKLFASQPPAKPKLSVVNGTDYFANTIKSVKLLGGMKKFVPKGAKVGLLINSGFETFPAYTSPDVVIATVKMCFDAKASEVISLQYVDPAYWKRSKLFTEYQDMINEVVNLEINKFPAKFDEENYVLADVPGVSLKKAEVVKKLFEVDVLINLPVAKHHGSTIYTGALKNTMGISTRKTNVGMHLDSGVRNDPDYLAQCIVDLNLLRVADLTITDATEVLISNGPMGPGETLKPLKIVAGTDMVSIDAYCCQLLGYPYEEVLTVTKGHAAGIGKMDFKTLNIKEV